MKHKAQLRIFLLITSFCIAGLAGCGGGNFPGQTTSQPSLPTPPTPASTTTYTGVNNPGYYTLTLDDVQKQFSYQPLTYPGAAKGSYFAATGGVLDLGNSNGNSLGLAVEQSGEAAVLRPGDSSAYPAIFVPQADCFAITGRLRYLYMTLSAHGSSVVSDGTAFNPIYGVFTASTSADGKSWTIGDNHGYAMPSIGAPNATPVEDGADPLTYSASCTSNNGIGTVTSDPTAAFVFPQNPQGTNPTFHFHPNGLFVEDRSPKQAPFHNSSAIYGQVGMAVPNSAVSPSAVGAGSYRGFVYEYDSNNGPATHPMALAAPADGSSTLAGGVYLNDDLSQAPGSQYAIALGHQDSTLNGLFTSAQLSVLDTSGICAAVAQDPTAGKFIHAGFDAQGRAVCLSRGVAIVSQIQGKYVLYFSSYDASTVVSGAFNSTALIQFYLYQQ